MRQPATAIAAAAVVAATVLLSACGTRPPAVAPPARADVPVASPPASPPAASPPVAAGARSRAALSPAAALAVQIRAALARERWPASFDPKRAITGAPEWMQDRCLDVSVRNAARCTYGPRTATRSVVLLGDSVAVGWLPGLRRAPALRDARIHVLTRRQCANLRGFVTPACRAHQDWALDQVRRIRPELVVLSARYQGGPTWQQWRTGTARMVATLTPYAKRVVVLAPPPDSADVRACFARGLPPRRCGSPVSLDWRRYAYSEWKAAGAQARFVDPRPWFCLSEQCPALVGDLPVTFDGAHLSGAYAARLGPVLSGALG